MGGPISLRHRPLRPYSLQDIQHEAHTRFRDVWTNKSCFYSLEGRCYILRVSHLLVCRRSKHLPSLTPEDWWLWLIFRTSLLSTYVTLSCLLRLFGWWLVSQLARVRDAPKYLTLQLTRLPLAPVKRLLNNIRKLVHVVVFVFYLAYPMPSIPQYQRNNDVSLNAQPPLIGRHWYILHNFGRTILYSIHLTGTGHAHIGIWRY